MFMIVLYHLFIKLDASIINDSAIYRTILFPLHVAVVCFVLISGYFGIKLSLKKLSSFLCQVLFYNVLAYVAYTFFVGDFTVKGLLHSFMPFTHNQDLWFVRTYLYLLLLSPILNSYLQITPPEKYKIMLLILIFISVYLGIKSDDISLKEGKNITNFILIYFIGHGLKNNAIGINCSLIMSIVIFFLFNMVFLLGYNMTFGHSAARCIYTWGWGYNSPLLIINAILLFGIFIKIKIHSKVILSVAKSVFPIYLIHSNFNVQKILWPFVENNFRIDNILFRNMICAMGIMLLCIAIDKCISPLYSQISNYLTRKITIYLY